MMAKLTGFFYRKSESFPNLNVGIFPILPLQQLPVHSGIREVQSNPLLTQNFFLRFSLGINLGRFTLNILSKTSNRSLTFYHVFKDKNIY